MVVFNNYGDTLSHSTTTGNVSTS